MLACLGLFFVLMAVSLWKVFAKAGQPGWACLIPIFNVYIILKIAQKPGWWLVLYFIPIVSIIIPVVVLVAVARNFGKGLGFGLGLAFLGFIFFPILAFGDDTYAH